MNFWSSICLSTIGTSKLLTPRSSSESTRFFRNEPLGSMACISAAPRSRRARPGAGDVAPASVQQPDAAEHGEREPEQEQREREGGREIAGPETAIDRQRHRLRD